MKNCLLFSGYAHNKAGNMVRKTIRVRSGAARSGLAMNPHESPRTGIRLKIRHCSVWKRRIR